MTDRGVRLSAAIFPVLFALALSAPAHAQVDYTFPNLYEHLMDTRTELILLDEPFNITNHSGATWSAFRVRIAARDGFGDPVCRGHLSGYSGAGLAMFANVCDEGEGDWERMTVFLLGVPDGAVHSFTLDIDALLPLGAVDYDIYGHPSAFAVLEKVLAVIPIRFGLWGPTAGLASDVPVLLENETGWVWSEVHLRMEARDVTGVPLQGSGFMDTNGDQQYYTGPGSPVVHGIGGGPGSEVLEIQNLSIDSGEDLFFTIDFKGNPVAAVDSVEIWADIVLTPTGVDVPVVGKAARLIGVDPNPFNPVTTVSFELERSSHVSLDVFDAAGRFVANLVDDIREAGLHHEPWNGRDSTGRTVAAGVYFARLQAGEIVETRRMALVK